jgi:uncharacterized protein YxjI
MLAQAYRCPIVEVNAHERYFEMNVHNRDFKLTQRYLSADDANNESLPEGQGHYLLIATPLKHVNWRDHSVAIRKSPTQPIKVEKMVQKRSGDERFDSEFTVNESANAFPEPWLDKEVRSDIRGLFKQTTACVALGVYAERLSFCTRLSEEEISPRTSEEILLRIGWFAGSLDRAVSGDKLPSTEPSIEEIDEVGQVESASNALPERGNAYRLTKNFISIGGDYTIKDGSGKTAYRVNGKFRFTVKFELRDAQKNALYSGREYLWNINQKFVISRDGMPYATMQREFVGNTRRILGSIQHKYIVRRETGDTLVATGSFIGSWKLMQEGAMLANIETDGFSSDIVLTKSQYDDAFVFAILIAIIRLNPPSQHGTNTD